MKNMITQLLFQTKFNIWNIILFSRNFDKNNFFLFLTQTVSFMALCEHKYSEGSSQKLSHHHQEPPNPQCIRAKKNIFDTQLELEIVSVVVYKKAIRESFIFFLIGVSFWLIWWISWNSSRTYPKDLRIPSKFTNIRRTFRKISTNFEGPIKSLRFHISLFALSFLQIS